MAQLVKTIHARIDGPLVRETAAGVAFLVDDATVWLPKSQLFELHYVKGPPSLDVRLGWQVRSVEIPGWLAIQKGLDCRTHLDSRSGGR